MATGSRDRALLVEAGLIRMDGLTSVWPGTGAEYVIGTEPHCAGIWDRCEELCKAKIPFIVISPQRSPLIQRDSMKHGASGLLVKPLSIKELLEYIHTLLGE